jgi:urease gamma subunit
MSFPVSASQLRSLNEQRKKDEIENRITSAIEYISETVVELARRDGDKLLIIDRRFVHGLTSYQIHKILKGLRLNFPDCIVIYTKLEGPEYTFVIDWDERNCTKRTQMHETSDSKMDLIPSKE